MTHLLSIIVLLLKINGTKSCRGELQQLQPSPYARTAAWTMVNTMQHGLQASRSRRRSCTPWCSSPDTLISSPTSFPCKLCCSIIHYQNAALGACISLRTADTARNFPHRYNTIMKIVFLATSFTIIYLMRYHKVIKVTYDRDQDTFRYHFLVLPCLVLAFFLNNERTPLEVSMGVGHSAWPPIACCLAC